MVSKDQGTSSTTVSTPSFSTATGNELLLAFVATDAPGTNTVVNSVSGGGLTWALVIRTNVQKGTSEIWRAFAPAALSNMSVSVTLSQKVVSSITVVSFSGVDSSGTNGSGAIGATGSGNARSGAPTATLTTTRNNSWVFGVGNDYDKAIARALGPNQTMVHEDLSPSGDAPGGLARGAQPAAPDGRLPMSGERVGASGRRLGGEAVRLEGLYKSFGDLEVLKGIDLAVGEHAWSASSVPRDQGQVHAAALHQPARAHRRRASHGRGC